MVSEAEAPAAVEPAEAGNNEIENGKCSRSRGFPFLILILNNQNRLEMILENRNNILPLQNKLLK